MPGADPNEPTRRAWARVLHGLGFARRGIVLVVCSGLLLLGLGATARAGCASPTLPEVRSLMEYQDLLFHVALWLGFVMALGGLWWSALLPGTWSERATPLGVGGLVAVGLLLAALQSTPGRIPPVDAPPGGVSALISAVVGTAALAGAALVVIQLARRLADDRLARNAALFGAALIVTAAANAEAATGFLFPEPVTALYAFGVIAAVNGATCFWLTRLLLRSEQRIRETLEAEALEAEAPEAEAPDTEAPETEPRAEAHSEPQTET